MRTSVSHCISLLNLLLTACQTEQDYKAWLAILEAVVEDYTDILDTGTGRPIHVDNPEELAIYVCTEAEFASLSTLQVQNVLSKKHILVLGSDGSSTLFDEPGLETLADLWKPVDMQGTSSRRSAFRSG